MSQRNVTALYLGNFKAFAVTQRVPLKPITLVFGPNSAGKSSVIQSLAFAHEAEFGQPKGDRPRLDVYKTRLGGDAIDLGGFRQFVYRHDETNFVEWGADLTLASFGNFKHKTPLEVSISVLVGLVAGQRSGAGAPATPRPRSLAISVAGQPFLAASYREPRPDGNARMRVDVLNIEHSVMQALFKYAMKVVEPSNGDTWHNGKTIRGPAFRFALGADDRPISDDDLVDIEPKPQTAEQIAVAFGWGVADAVLDVEGLLGLRLAGPVDAKGRSQYELSGFALDVPVQQWNDGPVALVWRELWTLVDEISVQAQAFLGTVDYLGPIRTLPSRNFIPGDSENQQPDTAGTPAWARVCWDASVREHVNGWLAKPELKTPYRLWVRNLIAAEDIEPALADELSRRARGNQAAPMEPIERRELLNKPLADACADLAERYAMNRPVAEEARALITPWIRKLEQARSPDARERLMSEADSAIAQWQDEHLANSDGSDEGPAHEGANNDWNDEETTAAIAAGFVQRLEQDGSTRKHQQLVLHDVKKNLNVSHRDVGTGISQVLPVLVAAYGSKDQTIAIEQPEIHLHPALQAELGDVFIESALQRGNTFILETHSEHLILRLLRRIRETTNGELPAGVQSVRPEDVQIIYVRPGDTGSRVLLIKVDPEGEFVEPWPDGFFPERAKELF